MRNDGIGILIGGFMVGGLCLFCSPQGNEKVIESATLMESTIHVYEVRPRKDKRGVDLISDVLPFGRLWYGGPNAISDAIGYAQFLSRSHDAAIRVYTKVSPSDRVRPAIRFLWTMLDSARWN
jgi:hypothetical protein